MKSHKDLVVWKSSIDLVVALYEVTKTFPEEEKFGIVAQLRRAAVSVPANIAEGAARRTRNEFVRFLNISLGSAAEVETFLIISERLRYVGDTVVIRSKIEDIRKMLCGLVSSLRKSDQ